MHGNNNHDDNHDDKHAVGSCADKRAQLEVLLDELCPKLAGCETGKHADDPRYEVAVVLGELGTALAGSQTRNDADDLADVHVVLDERQGSMLGCEPRIFAPGDGHTLGELLECLEAQTPFREFHDQGACIRYLKAQGSYLRQLSKKPPRRQRVTALRLGNQHYQIGDERITLTYMQDQAIKTLIELGGSATLDQLRARTVCDGINKVLTRLLAAHPILRPYLMLPGQNGGGGYQTNIRLIV